MSLPGPARGRDLRPSVHKHSCKAVARDGIKKVCGTGHRGGVEQERMCVQTLDPGLITESNEAFFCVFKEEK